MSREADLLLGMAFALLDQCRTYFINKDDVDGVTLIENQYQSIQSGINAHYYGQPMEKINDR